MEESLKKEENRANKITEGVIWKQIVLFFFPILLGTFFQQLYNTIDAVVVGQYAGKEALACVGGSPGQVINLVVGFFSGLTNGCAVMISRFYGAKEDKHLDEALHSAYAFSLLGGVFGGIVCFILATPLMQLMNTAPVLMDGSVIYMRVYFAGLVFVLIYNMGSAVLRAVGDSRRPLYYLIICCIINIVLDLLFVAVFHTGVLGAAVATLISQAVSAILVTRTLMYHTDRMQLKLKKIRLHKVVLKKMLSIGLPTGIQSSMYSLSNMIIQTSVNGFGVNTTAAWTAYGKIDSLFWMIDNAFGISATTFVAQNYGAGKWHRIRKATRECLGMALLTAIFFSCFNIICGGFFLRIFTADADVISIGVKMIREIAPAYALFIFIEIFSAVLKAEGHVIVTTIITMIGICGLRIVWLLGIVRDGSLAQVLACYPLTWGISAVAVVGYYLYKQRKVLAEHIER